MLEKRLSELEYDIEVAKSELADRNARLQLLIARMERQLNQYDRSPNPEESIKINHGELLSTHGILGQPKQAASSPHELTSSIPTL